MVRAAFLAAGLCALVLGCAPIGRNAPTKPIGHAGNQDPPPRNRNLAQALAKPGGARALRFDLSGDLESAGYKRASSNTVVELTEPATVQRAVEVFRRLPATSGPQDVPAERRHSVAIVDSNGKTQLRRDFYDERELLWPFHGADRDFVKDCWRRALREYMKRPPDADE